MRKPNNRPSKVGQRLLKVLRGRAIQADSGEIAEIVKIELEKNANVADPHNWKLTLVARGADKGDRQQWRFRNLSTLSGGAKLLSSLLVPGSRCP
jgi:hypothetical protein